MDANHFDTLTRSLTDAHSRRGAVAALLGGTLGVLGLTDTTAKKGKGKGRKKKRKDKGNGDTGQTPGATPPPAPTCGDGIKNGSETDVDCGGSCQPCANGQGCARRADCAGDLVCSGGTCQACTANAQCGQGCFCNASVCLTSTSVALANGCGSCPSDTVCVGTGIALIFNCHKRCGAP